MCVYCDTYWDRKARLAEDLVVEDCTLDEQDLLVEPTDDPTEEWEVA